ncbi:MAG: L-threonylcarbamoyladenylate synthase [Eubacteriales bacterium]|nr:L-threonylcarbamoyladenylate synthase [Eubacteriales bacterium]
MKTIIAKIQKDNELENKEIYRRAGEILRGGGLVAFPTETVYGLGADALDEKASAKIYAAKGRPSDNPLIVHIADKKDLYKLSSCVNDNAVRLAQAFWPGPLTMILKKADIVPASITGGLDTVAIRMPSHPVAEKLIKEAGVYVAAPSANTSGRPSPTRAAHVIDDLSGRIDMIIEDDTVDIGVESTIVDLSEEVPTILRPGYITEQMLSQVLDSVITDPGIMTSVKAGVVPKAPGMKYKHYAPNADLAIVEGSMEHVIDYINTAVKEKEKQGFKVGIMATDETKDRYKSGMVYSVGSRKSEASVAHNLFAQLRAFDQLGAQYIYSESFSTDNVGQAVMNRLIKAAGHTIINV